MSEIAWAAGLFEGEGTIYVPTQSRPFGLLSIGSTDKDVLDRFAAVMGGKVYGPWKGQGRNTPAHYKLMYRWQIGGICEIQAVLRQFWPYLSERRRAKAAEAIAGYYEVQHTRIPRRRNLRALTVRV